MARRRFFVDQVRNQRAELNGDDAHHLTRVLRVEQGQHYEISDNGSVYLAEVTEAHKSRVVFSVMEKLPPAPEVVHLTLFQALFKFDHFEWVLEKGTEAGVERFVPVLADRTEKGLDRAAPKRMTRWERILLEASQQSRRDSLPRIEPPVSFARAVSSEGPLRYLLDEQPGAPALLEGLPERSRRACSDQVALLIGPEGGWTGAERGRAVAVGWSPVSLGPNILRAETAAIATVSVIMNAWWAAVPR